MPPGQNSAHRYAAAYAAWRLGYDFASPDARHHNLLPAHGKAIEAWVDARFIAESIPGPLTSDDLLDLSLFISAHREHGPVDHQSS